MSPSTADSVAFATGPDARQRTRSPWLAIASFASSTRFRAVSSRGCEPFSIAIERAHLEKSARRPLHIRDQPGRLAMKRRHELSFARKGHHAFLRAFTDERRSIDACLFGGRQQRNLDRIAVGLRVSLNAGLRPAGHRSDLEGRSDSCIECAMFVAQRRHRGPLSTPARASCAPTSTCASCPCRRPSPSRATRPRADAEPAHGAAPFDVRRPPAQSWRQREALRARQQRPARCPF